jgi:hypothetical protein
MNMLSRTSANVAWQKQPSPKKRVMLLLQDNTVDSITQ